MAIVFGAGLGFAVPETPYEDNLLGETRDKLADKAQEAAQDFDQKVRRSPRPSSTKRWKR